jgi:hypothetical protein
MKAQYLTYQELVESGKLSKNRQKVYMAIKRLNEPTLYSISLVTMLPEKTVSGRISELMDLGIVEVAKTRTEQYMKSGCKTHVSLFRVVTDPEKIKRNIEQQKRFKFRKTCKALVTKYPEFLDEFTLQTLQNKLI